jgi:hypothetical protein
VARSLVFIHRTSQKGNSAKSIYRILHRILS